MLRKTRKLFTTSWVILYFTWVQEINICISKVFSDGVAERKIVIIPFHKFQKQPQEGRCSVRKGVLTNFANFTGKHLCQSLFLIKLQASASKSIKKETLAQLFSCEVYKIYKNTFFIKHHWATASETSVIKTSVRKLNTMRKACLCINLCFNTINWSMGKKESVCWKMWVSGSKILLPDEVIANWSKTYFSQRLGSGAINNWLH